MQGNLPFVEQANTLAANDMVVGDRNPDVAAAVRAGKTIRTRCEARIDHAHRTGC